MLAAALLALPALAQSAPDNWKFKLDGYYRTRGHLFADLYEGQALPGTYMQHRLRLIPEVNFEDRAKLFLTIDGLDGVVWGDNQSLASTALFAGDPSATGIEGVDVAPIQLERVWTEFKVPVGLLRVGRQGSHWGMGLLANDGNGLDNDLFGENKFGSTYDRVIFATRPVTVVTTIASMVSPKAKPIDFPLITAIGVDRLVEDPLIQYYGYSCSVENPDDGCPQLEDHGVTEERDAERRTDTWWVDPQDDVFEMIYVVMYRNDGQKFGKNLVGDVTLGTYIVNRMQAETDSNVLIVDGYGKIELAGVVAEVEVLSITGETRAITLQNPDPEAEDPLFKQAGIAGYVARAGYQNELFTGMMEYGYASGDDDVTDENFTGRPLHPDHNVGLLLYEEIIARVTAEGWGEDARGLWSNGGVYNSRYIYPNVRFRPMKGWEIVGAFLVAWPDKPDGALILCAQGDDVECPERTATADILGWEADIGLKHRWADHLNFTLEAGYAHATDRLPLEGTGLQYELDDRGRAYGNYFTVQSRIAYEF
jgi:hypothetical protein